MVFSPMSIALEARCVSRRTPFDDWPSDWRNRVGNHQTGTPETSWPMYVCCVVIERSESVARATPESITFGLPAESTRMVAGFRSR